MPAEPPDSVAAEVGTADSVEAPEAVNSLPDYSLRGWLGKLTARRWLRLFLFEFFVILLGVLAAQGLQSWFADRAEVREAARAKATLDRNLGSIAQSAEIRLRSMACYSLRLSRLGTALSQGAASPLAIEGPDEALVIDLGWSGDVPALVSDHYNPETVEHYANAVLWVDSLRRAQAAEQANWTNLARLSPAFGGPDAADRSIAKGALVSAARNLQVIGYSANHLRDHALAMGINSHLEELRDLAVRANAKGVDPCKAAMTFTIDEHQAAFRRGKLVTGESLTYGAK